MPERVLVDTDVVSFVFRGDSRAQAYRKHLDGKQLAVSFMTVAELDRWTLERNWGADRRAALESYLQRFVVYLVDRRLCSEWAAVTDAARRAGRPILAADAWIAATARAHGLILVTHNAADYAGIDNLSIATEEP